MTQINEDGFTREEIETALTVLEHVFDNETEPVDANSVATAQMLVRQYKGNSEWREEQPADTVDPDDYKQLGTQSG